MFIQSLFFKFSGSEETAIIFGTIADWMAGIAALSWLAEPFRAQGGRGRTGRASRKRFVVYSENPGLGRDHRTWHH